MCSQGSQDFINALLEGLRMRYSENLVLLFLCGSIGEFRFPEKIRYITSLPVISVRNLLKTERVVLI
jgi:hypothetical protein